MLYQLSYSWHETYSPRLLEGPVQYNWSDYCDSLLPEAVKRALTPKDDRELSWIGWDEIVDGMVEVLQEKGYKLVKPEEKTYWGSCIIMETADSRSKEDWLVLDAVKEHNKALNDKNNIATHQYE